jgi:hypothetical protein
MNKALVDKVKKVLCKDQDFFEVDNDLYVKFDQLKLHYENNEITFSVILNGDVISEHNFHSTFNEGDSVHLNLKGLFQLVLDQYTR